MKPRAVTQGLLAAAMLLLLAWLFINGSSATDQAHSRVLQAIDAIRHAKSSLHADALLNRAGLQQNYDVLNRDMALLRASLQEVESALADTVVPLPETLDDLLQDLSQSVAEQERMLEQFKSMNAVTQNSLMYFSLNSDRLVESHRDAMDHESGTLVASLLGDMLRFMRNPASGADRRIRPLLQRMKAAGLESVQEELLLRHSEKVLEMLPALTELLDQLLAIPVQQQASAVAETYLAAHRQHEERASTYRLLSFIMSLLLAVYLVHLFIRNRTHAVALERSNRALVQEKSRAETTLTSIGDGVITTDLEGRVQYLNPIASYLLGKQADSLSGQPLASGLRLKDSEGEAVDIDPVCRCLAEGRPLQFHEGYVLDDGNAHRHIVELSAAPMVGDSGQVIGCVLVLHDVSETHALIERISHQAMHDDLTGMLNRSEFEVRVAQAIEEARSQEVTHCLCYLDLDQFKVVNDTCGHAAGDQLLKQLSQLLLTGIRATDTMARLGGDEFGILLNRCELSRAQQVAEHLRSLLQDFRFSWQGRFFDVGASIGLVAITAETMDVAQALSQVDVACYMAKDLGRNRVHIYHQEDQGLRQRENELQWASRLTQALEDGRLLLFGQRIASVSSKTDGQLNKYEVLLRLQDEEGQLVPPGAFIPAAERYNLMHTVDRWVISKALGLLAIIPDEHCPQFSINLSGNSLGEPKLLEFITEQLQVNGVSPNKVCFEITETAAILNLTQAIKLIESLKALGCEFALDDFGAGLSSFSYLKTLPVDYVKIDGSFVRDMTSDPVDRAMVESINQVGHIMGKRTVAEFVEDEETLDSLRELGVDYAQGYGIGMPMPMDMVLSAQLKPAQS